jgi:anti-sigma regulatory factor (Ser/Thr protein kinase)
MFRSNEIEGDRAMTADPDGSGTAYGRHGAADEGCRARPVTGAGWRGPGWRVFDGRSCYGKEVRDWLAGVVGRHGCPADSGDVALVVSELFANALMHGPAGGRVLVGYCLWPGGARIVVCDAGGAAIPRLREFGDTEEGGRGLHVVDALAASWGTFRIGHVRAVWCDLMKPLCRLGAGDEWAWLRPVLATVDLDPAASAEPTPANKQRPSHTAALATA